MDSNFVDWEAAYEQAGLWPVAVELPDGDVAFLLWYQTRKEPSRVVTSGGRAVILPDLEAVGSFLRGCGRFGLGDPGWDAARRLAKLSGGQQPDETTVPRRLVGQSLEWLHKLPAHPTYDQVEELLHSIDFLGEWHHTLHQTGAVGPWPVVLDGAASLLSEAVIWGSITPQAAFERTYFLGIWPLMERLVSDLLCHTMTVSSDRPAA